MTHEEARLGQNPTGLAMELCSREKCTSSTSRWKETNNGWRSWSTARQDRRVSFRQEAVGCLSSKEGNCCTRKAGDELVKGGEFEGQAGRGAEEMTCCCFSYHEMQEKHGTKTRTGRCLSLVPLYLHVRWLLKEIVADVPLVAAVVVEKLRACEEEAPPPGRPERDVLLSIHLGKDGADSLHVTIHPTKPDLESLGIVSSIHCPVLDKLERMAEVKEKVIRRHRSSGEEVFSHPVVISFSFKIVCEMLVHKDVDKHFPSWLQPLDALAHQSVIILHVLEHLNAADAIETLALGSFEVVHVACDHCEIFQPAFFCSGLDVLSLSIRV
mmetsp:Transcript_31123/g.99884  ORF Transcript_31123/g.99884 Transcript_31123/m.99884 type:complete len:326 (+) Transcript_31123:64-1041(+)